MTAADARTWTQTPTRYLKPTALLDFDHPSIQRLIARRGWRELEPAEAIPRVYDFCRNELRFGYNPGSDGMAASAVLGDGFGQCNTKATLLMALLRSLRIPCRLHAVMVDIRLQKGALGKTAYAFAPAEVLHTWTEVWWEDRWVALEGVILDDLFLARIQALFESHEGPFMGYAVGTTNLQHPAVKWCGTDTWIQSTAVTREVGVYDDPDACYAEHGTNLRGARRLLYRAVLCRLMNRNIERIRAGRLSAPRVSQMGVLPRPPRFALSQGREP